MQVRRVVCGMDLFEIKVEITPASVEETDNLLLELGIEGWSLLEDVIEKRAWVVGIFQSGDEARAQWDALRPQLGGAPIGEAGLRALGNSDWRDSYKAHFKAWKFGRLHWVPVWERDKFTLPGGEEVIWLDPGMAFGTGNHETTRLCVERLVELPFNRDARVIDAGCGSGILALSAAKLGYENVRGFDNDPDAVRVSIENAELNDMAGRVDFFTGDLVTGLAGHKAGIVMANILANVLIEFARELTDSVAPGGVLILSGILASENEQVRDAYAKIVPQWKIEHRTMGEWSDVLLRAP
ncbi:ribosomal protein L11 methyltransferase [Ereboglobus sp. PH5-10]|nr:ribosomal protein L11 methyltransferase [Ereboglobus sp. PH5-10]